jgi:hypothetical protein
MTMHEAEWREMDAEQKLEQLRLTAIVQEVFIRCLIKAVGALGVRFVGGEGDGEQGEEDSGEP